ncbi:hypothetical protein MJT46_018207 [Ovis ammon polii x Ovis aries]|nr:hypothetical protein MJT46_018207 [Ovis ammon polii x Ovis aries]
MLSLRISGRLLTNPGAQATLGKVPGKERDRGGSGGPRSSRTTAGPVGAESVGGRPGPPPRQAHLRPRGGPRRALRLRHVPPAILSSVLHGQPISSSQPRKENTVGFLGCLWAEFLQPQTQDTLPLLNWGPAQRHTFGLAFRIVKGGPFLMGSPPTSSQGLDLLLEDREAELSEAQEKTVTNRANHVVLGQAGDAPESSCLCSSLENSTFSTNPSPFSRFLTQGERTEDVSREHVHTQALFQCPLDMFKQVELKILKALFSKM